MHVVMMEMQKNGLVAEDGWQTAENNEDSESEQLIEGKSVDVDTVIADNTDAPMNGNGAAIEPSTSPGSGNVQASTPIDR